MASTYEKISTTTLGSAAADVTFSSISGSYTDLVAICNFGAVSSAQDFRIRFNSDTGSNYSYTSMRGSTAATYGKAANTNSIIADLAGVPTSLTAIDIIHIMDYSNTTTRKGVLIRANAASSSTELCVGLWKNTAAITSITLSMTSGNLLSGSTFTLYGILKA